jgi:hypothetical protein
VLRFIFRIAFFLLGLVVLYWFGGSVVQTIQHRLTGTTVEGRIVGFASRGGKSILTDGTGIRKGKNRARRPVFTYPIAAGSRDSLTAKSSTGAFFTFTQYDLNEPVTVVFATNDPTNAHIFGFQPIFVSLLVCLLGVFMLYLGIKGRA